MLPSKALLTITLTLIGFFTMADDKFTSEAQLPSRLNNEINHFWQQGSFADFQGVHNTRINYATFTHSEVENQSADKCIVISSGRSETYLKYQELSYDLFNLGYDIFLVDHRGQGLSERELPNPHKGYVKEFQHYVDDLGYFINTIVGDQCQSKPYLLAHSMGAAIAARYLQDYPDSIKAAVLSSPMLGFNNGGLPEVMAEYVIKGTTQVNEWFDETPWYFFGHQDYTVKSFTNNALTHSTERYQIFSELYQKTPTIQLGGVTTTWLTASLNGLEKIFNNLERLKTPIIVLQAGDDKIVSNEAQNEFCQQLHLLQPQSCPDGKPLVIEQADHELFFEIDIYREKALTAVIDWFEKH